MMGIIPYKAMYFYLPQTAKEAQESATSVANSPDASPEAMVESATSAEIDTPEVGRV